MELKHIIRKVIFVLTCLILTTSCSSGKIVISNNTDISKYKYVIFGDEITGDRLLEDINMSVRNLISENLTVLSKTEYKTTLCLDSILTPNIRISSLEWGKGHTQIAVSFYEYKSSQSVAVVKVSGLDPDIALKAIETKFIELFEKHQTANNL